MGQQKFSGLNSVTQKSAKMNRQMMFSRKFTMEKKKRSSPSTSHLIISYSSTANSANAPCKPLQSCTETHYRY